MSFKNVLFVFKDRKSVTLNNDFWTNKFNHLFNVTQFFINDNLKLSNSEIVSLINEIIDSKKINIIMFEGDHAHIINHKFVQSINKNIKKGIFLGDDMVWHNLNLITAQSCDFVFSSCPISSLKFEEVGVKSFFVPIECDDNLLKDYKEKKIYDVLHFGRDKTKRKEYIKFLESNNIKIKSVTPYDEASNTFEKLAKLINQSKIIINFSESDNGNRKFNPLRIFKSFYQLKGRIQMAGLCNSLCITEYSPSIYIMYDKDELPSFSNKKECLEKINFYLSNEEKLKDITKKFYTKSLTYGDSQYIKKISSYLDSIEIKDKVTFKTPIWYNLIFLNQTLRLRFKRALLRGFFKEFIANFKYNKNYNTLNYLIQLFMNIIIFLRFFPFLISKKIFKFNYEKN